jgi:hypothetical protein
MKILHRHVLAFSFEQVLKKGEIDAKSQALTKGFEHEVMQTNYNE